jgi:hypothetical protein
MGSSAAAGASKRTVVRAIAASSDVDMAVIILRGRRCYDDATI